MTGIYLIRQPQIKLNTGLTRHAAAGASDRASKSGLVRITAVSQRRVLLLPRTVPRPRTALYLVICGCSPGINQHTADDRLTPTAGDCYTFDLEPTYIHTYTRPFPSRAGEYDAVQTRLFDTATSRVKSTNRICAVRWPGSV